MVDEHDKPPAREERGKPWKRAAAALAVYTLLMAAPIWATWTMYFWEGHEELFPIYRTQQMVESWTTGGGLAGRWMGGACYGYGWPFFTFYAPLGYQVAAAAHLALGLSLGAATKLSFLMALALSGLLMGGLAWTVARREGSRMPEQWGLAVGMLYAMAPYHLTDVFVRTALAENWAWAAMAGAMWGVEASRRRPAAGAAGTALGVAALALSHNISALYGAGVIAIYTLATAPWGRGGWRWTVRVAGAGALGLALSAWFWLPALALIGDVRAGDAMQFFGEPAWLRAQALYWPQFFMEQWGHGSNRLGMDDTLSLNPGGLVMFGALAAAAALRSQPLKGEARRRVAACLGLGLALMFAMGHWMPWQWMPGMLRYIQFPWRLLLFLVLLATLALASAGAALERRLRPWWLTLAAGSVGLTMFFLVLLEPSERATHDADLTAWYREREAKTGLIAGCNAGEYRPIWVDERYVDPKWQAAHPAPADRLETSSGTLTVESYRREGARHFWRYAAEKNCPAKAHVFDFPGWRLTIDGRLAPERLGRAPDGLMALRLPAGRHQIELRYAQPPVAIVAQWISMGGVLALFGWIATAWAGRRGRGNAEDVEDQSSERAGP